MWFYYFDYVKTNSGAYLLEVDEQLPLKEDGKIVRFQSFGEAEDYLIEQNIRGIVRDVIDEANDE